MPTFEKTNTAKGSAVGALFKRYLCTWEKNGTGRMALTLPDPSQEPRSSRTTLMTSCAAPQTATATYPPDALTVQCEVCETTFEIPRSTTRGNTTQLSQTHHKPTTSNAGSCKKPGFRSPLKNKTDPSNTLPPLEEPEQQPHPAAPRTMSTSRSLETRHTGGEQPTARHGPLHCTTPGCCTRIHT